MKALVIGIGKPKGGPPPPPPGMKDSPGMGMDDAVDNTDAQEPADEMKTPEDCLNAIGDIIDKYRASKDEQETPEEESGESAADETAEDQGYGT